MPDTQEQTLFVLFNMCITSSILIGLPIQKAGMSLWVIFTSWLTCCKTEEFDAGGKKRQKENGIGGWISAHHCHWGKGWAACPQHPAAAAQWVQQVHYLDEAFLSVTVEERMLLEGFCFIRAVIKRSYKVLSFWDSFPLGKGTNQSLHHRMLGFSVSHWLHFSSYISRQF